MKNMLWKTLIVGLSLAVSAAFAQTTPPAPTKETPPKNTMSKGTGDASFDELDSNNDGFLTKDEVLGNPAIAQNFSRIDKNGDGKISPEEWKEFGHKK